MKSVRKPIYAVGIIEKSDNEFLVVRREQPPRVSRIWQFPRGPARPGESPEAAMRRMASEDVGLGVEVLIGQPPLVLTLDGQEVEVRYFFCGVIHGELRAGPYAEWRWVPKSQLPEYEYDECTRPVVQWLLEDRQ